MKLAIGISAIFLVFAEFAEVQTNGRSSGTETLAPVSEAATEGYTIFGATPSQEAALRVEIRLMHPEVLPLRRGAPKKARDLKAWNESCC